MFYKQRDILDYKPERLALTGYRCAMAGYDHGDISCWDELWSSYVSDGGLGFACNIMGSLQYFVRSIRPGLAHGVQYYPRNCRRVCRQECLVLAVLAASQHGDKKVRDYSLLRLLGDAFAEQESTVTASALHFANGLSREKLTLLPVPLAVIQSIEEQVTCPRFCTANIH